ncbi:MAG TPA: hypothetical protein VHB02_19645 [Acidimicrobiales bacterium]|nr:hypothetical protein [Acidimicrobiales bacterium]
MPLLPRSLRQAFSGTALPPIVAVDLGLPVGATVADLDGAGWCGGGRPPALVVEFLLGLVGSRKARDLRIMADPWPGDVRPGQVLWPTRLGRALRQADLLAADRLERLTYGRLLAIPATGRKTALEMGVIVDALAGTPAAPLDAAARRRLAEAARWAWTARVGSHDGRFRDVLPPHPGRLDQLLADAAADPDGRLARALAHALPAVVDRAEHLGREPLDRAVTRLSRALGVSPRDLAITTARLDRSGGGLRKLHDVGRPFSVSKERARQVIRRTTGRLRDGFLPQLGIVGRQLGAWAPVPAADAAHRLVRAGLCMDPVDPAFVAALADLLGYPVPFQVDAGGGVPLVVPPGLAVGRAVLSAATRLAKRDGILSVDQVVAAVAREGAAHNEGDGGGGLGGGSGVGGGGGNVGGDDDGDVGGGDGDGVVDVGGRAGGRPWLPTVVRLVLRSSPATAHLAGDWFWLPGQGPGRHCVRNVTRRMLAVSSPLDLPTLRGGLVRQRHGVRVSEVPPEAVLAAYYDAHPDFVLEGHTVRSAGPLDLTALLAPAEQALVATLRAAPAARLSRAALERGARARGVDHRQFDSVVTYTPVVVHSERDVWRLRT